MEQNYSFLGYIKRTFQPHLPEISRKNGRIMVTFLIIFIILLSVFAFSKQSLRLDESQSIWQSSHSLFDTYNIIARDVHVPLYETLLHFLLVFFGSNVVIVRLLSLFFFIVSVPALYYLGSLAYNRRIGIFAALIFSISAFMNWYGNESRMYSLFVFLTILNQIYFIRLWRDKKGSSWLGYTITGFLGIYTHYFFFLSLLTQAVFYFFNRSLFEKDALKKFIRTALILFVGILPWIWYVYYVGKAGNSTPLIAVPTTINLFNSFSQFLFGFQNDHLNTILVSLWPITVLLAFLTLRKNQGLKKETIYFIVSLIFPIILTFSISLTLRPVFLTRYLIFTLPSLYIFLSYLILNYRHFLSVFLRILLITVMLVTLGVEIVNANAPVKENYREASAYLSEHAGHDDIIVVSAPFTIYPVEYYYKSSATLTTLPIWDQYKPGSVPPFVAANLPTEVNQLVANHANLWLLLSYDQGYEKDIKEYFDQHFQMLDSQNFSYGLNLYEYKTRY